MNRWNERGIIVAGLAAVIAGSAAFGASLSDAEIWPQFRGSQGAGLAEGQRVPVNLGKETLRWSIDLPGPGSSSPVIWGDRLFVTSEIREEGRLELSCLDAKSGAKRWSTNLTSGDYHTHKFNNLATGTPCVTEELVILGWFDAGSAHAMLSAYTHKGALVWTKDLGTFESQHGVSFNPVVHDDRVLVTNAHLTGGYIGAFSLKDGSELWNVPNPTGGKTSYVAPLVREIAGSDAKEVVVVGQLIGMVGLDFETGKTNWSLRDVFPARTISSPIIVNANTQSDDVLVAAGCKDGVYIAARVPRMNDGKAVSEAEIAWSMESRTPYVTTPISDGTTVYALHDGGTLTAMNAETGSVAWQDRLVGNFFASPVLADGKLYCLSRTGKMWIAEAGKEFKVVRTIEMNPPEDATWCDATPAVAHNRLYVRLGSRLDCY